MILVTSTLTFLKCYSVYFSHKNFQRYLFQGLLKFLVGEYFCSKLKPEEKFQTSKFV